MTTRKEKTKHIDELHFEHKLWMNEVEFYKTELSVFNKRLTEVAGMYTDKDVLASLEHFQNQFILQNEVADILMHDLNQHEQVLVDSARKSVIAIDHKAFADHPEMRNRMDSFIKIFRDTRNEYMRFLSKVM